MLRNLLRLSASGKPIYGTPDIGILASQIIAETATGDSGPGLLYDESLAQTGRQLRVNITSWNGTAGTLFVEENGRVTIEGQANGAYTIGYDWEAWATDGSLNSGSDTASVTVGAVTASAGAGTGTSTGTGAGGEATGTSSGSGSVTAGTGTSTGTGSGGEAFGGSGTDGSAAGGTGVGAGTGTGGNATGVVAQNATAGAGTGTSAGSGTGGDAYGLGIMVRAPSGSGPSLVYVNTTRPPNIGGARY